MTDKKHKIFDFELEKLVDSLNTTQNLRLQVGIFFGTINLTALGIALQIHTTSLIIIAALTMLLFIFCDIVLIRTIYGFYYRALTILRDKYEYEEETIFDMFMLFLRKEKVTKIHEISKIPSIEERMNKLRRLPFLTATIMGFWAPLSLLFFEVGFAIYLNCFQHWKLY